MMLGDTNNRFSASRAVVVLASGLLVGLFLVALLSQMLARIDALDALTQDDVRKHGKVKIVPVEG